MRLKGLIFILCCFLSAVLFLSQICNAIGVEQTYEWNHVLYGRSNTYEAFLDISDNWQVDNAANVTFEVDLIEKGSRLNYTEIVNVVIQLRGSLFTIQSEALHEPEILQEAGDYWQKNVSFLVPAEDVARGQTDNVSISFEITYNEIDRINENSTQAIYNSTTAGVVSVSLFRPYLSNLESIEIIVPVVSVIGIIGFLLYVRKRRKASQGTAQPKDV
ncbi:MAG TPA: hypothetical protein VMT01_04240 [Candidatus Acidoferrum sp.]|jgi:hypothetical protein|nr:hypothetical protein [Candidatus Acidoferrum sp.]